MLLAQCLKLYFLFAAFLIVGGETDENDLTTEVIDVPSKSNVVTSPFGEIPSERIYAVGGLIGSTPIICGGYDIFKDQDSCFTYNQFQWTKTHTMTTKRSYASSVQLNATTLWICM